MSEGKILQVADSIHGTIQISELEKHIISTQPFNRLHNILQNSTVYLTYPSNQTKRFAHSLGVMHLGGEMLFHSLVNADEDIRDELLNQTNEEIKKIIDDSNFNQILREHLDDYVDIASRFESINCSDLLYQLYTPRLIKNEHLFAYDVLYQSVRCAALLHDVGHPPFSHITEFSIKKVIELLEPTETRNYRKTNFIEITQKYSDKNINLHEQIGNRIAARLMEFVVRKNKPAEMDENRAKKHLFYLIVQRFTINILEEANSFYEDIHRIVDGPIDCDRLDYVTRDIENSGFTQGSIEYDRLISSMKLMKNEDNYLFCPDIRTLSTVEDFFQRRWFLYKYVIFHHRVIKTDYLLGKAVEKLTLDYLESDEEDVPISPDNPTLPLDISGLWKGINEVYSDSHYFNWLIQWDDSWLTTVLRQQYFLKYQHSDDIVKDQLEELLSNKKIYHSIVKRMNDFQEIDHSVFAHFNFPWDQVTDIDEELKKYIDSLKNVDGFFLTAVKKLFEFIQDDDQYKKAVEESINEVSAKIGFKDCIVDFKRLKTGLEKMPYLHRKTDLVLLNHVSRIDNELSQNQLLFPTFFVYVSLNPSQKLPLSEFREEIGKKIADKLTDLLSELLLNK